MNPDPFTTIPLGQSDVQISPLGIGVWSWGDRWYWGYGRTFGEEDVRGAFEESIAAGVTLFDTAELYGFGESERILGRFAREAFGDGDLQAPPTVIASKYLPVPWRPRTRRNLVRALRRSLMRLGVEQIDLYQVHWPIHPISIETWASGLADVVEGGMARAVGVSNFTVDQVRRAHRVLAARGIPLASNQVAYSLMQREPERNGVQGVCADLGVTLIAYSPLAEGLLTGKYTPSSPPRGYRGWRVRDDVRVVQPLIERMRTIGDAHGGKTPGQVALNWLMSKGAVPIPGAKNRIQAHENSGAMGWRLSSDEVAHLNVLSNRRS